MVMTASTATLALTGCMFGDDPKQQELGPWHWQDQNCVPAECLFECCDGWNWTLKPSLVGGNVPGLECKQVAEKNSDYAFYVALMLEDWNACTDEFRHMESGYCYVIQPPDAIKEFTPDNQPVYSGLSFPVCPPRGQTAGHPVEGVELAPEK
jgi:hypothetical protein